MAAILGVAAAQNVTVAGRPLRWGEIEAYLAEVGAELERRELERTIVVVGGAYVAYHGVRTATIDVDTINELDDELRRTPNDTIDLQALWPKSDFTTPAEAVAAFYAAYPHKEPDPHLADWIASVLNAD